MHEVKQSMSGIFRSVILGGLIVGLVVAIVSYFVSQRITNPIMEMTAGAQRYAKGDFKRKALVPNSLELSTLAVSLNDMAAELDTQIKAISRHRNELEAVFAGMEEGVLALDMNRQIIKYNRPALEILGIDENQPILGRHIIEVVRNVHLRQFVNNLLERHISLEEEFSLHGGSRILQAHGNFLYDYKGGEIGVVIVFNDITRLKKLESLRKDFVANVSHELKTPLTSIKGFVETLLDGAIENTDDAKHFLSIVERQVNRLTEIVDDLLTLSKVEQSTEQNSIILEATPLAEVLASAVKRCSEKALKHSKRLEINCSESIKCNLNPNLFEQAVVNLIDNAVFYSKKGDVIEITGEVRENEFIVSVIDQGVGIPPEHLPRIFERFYRVESDRSRNIGGSGLGLSIVKHIAKAHNGDVSVSSIVNTGTTFRIHLPKK